MHSHANIFLFRETSKSYIMLDILKFMLRQISRLVSVLWHIVTKTATFASWLSCPPPPYKGTMKTMYTLVLFVRTNLC